MPKQKKNPSGDQPTFHLTVRPEGQYRVRTLHVAIRGRVNVASELRACQSEDHRARLQRTQYWGIDTHYVPQVDGAAIRIQWLEQQGADGQWEAATPDIDAGEQYEELKRGLELLRKVGMVAERRRREPTNRTFYDPNAVVRNLRRSRLFVEVERFEGDARQSYWIETVPALAEVNAA